MDCLKDEYRRVIERIKGPSLINCEKLLNSIEMAQVFCMAGSTLSFIFELSYNSKSRVRFY